MFVLMRDDDGACSCLHQLDTGVIAAKAYRNIAGLDELFKMRDVVEQQHVARVVFFMVQAE